MSARQIETRRAERPRTGSRRAWLCLLALAVCALALGALAGCTAPPNTVMIHDLVFDPGAVTVAKGTTITWQNKDEIPVQIQSDDFGTTPTVPGQFSSEPLNPGETYTHTFDDAGSFGYSDPFHPFIKGTVVVK
jgi:plastocyanin